MIGNNYVHYPELPDILYETETDEAKLTVLRHLVAGLGTLYWVILDQEDDWGVWYPGMSDGIEISVRQEALGQDIEDYSDEYDGGIVFHKEVWDTHRLWWRLLRRPYARREANAIEEAMAFVQQLGNGPLKAAIEA